MEAALTASRERLLELLGLGSDATLDAVKRRYRELRVKPDRDYRRRGDDLLVQLAISVDEAFAGTRWQLATPSGPVTVVIPRHSRRGDVIRIVGRGVPGPRGRGDLFVELSS